MTLIIQKPTGAKLVLAKDFSFDADAAAYIAAVEAADTQALETATRYAINDFVIGCKQDGIWSAIKASCILAGARTLTGALIPLAGTAPTNNNFVSGDYNRKTGLVGDGSTKNLDSNRNNNVDPQNSKHLSAYVTAHLNAADTSNQLYIGTQYNFVNSCTIARSGSTARLYYAFCNSDFVLKPADLAATGLLGVNRSASSSFTVRAGMSSYLESLVSAAPRNETISVFRGGIGSVYSSSRLAFYSIGESLDLALLDARVTALITAFGVAIP
jgi:hypothetical protein